MNLIKRVISKFRNKLFRNDKTIIYGGSGIGKVLYAGTEFYDKDEECYLEEFDVMKKIYDKYRNRIKKHDVIEDNNGIISFVFETRKNELFVLNEKGDWKWYDKNDVKKIDHINVVKAMITRLLNKLFGFF